MGGIVGLIMTTWNDCDAFSAAYDSLFRSMPSLATNGGVPYGWGFCVVDGGSGPEELECIKDFCSRRTLALFGEAPDLTDALNVGIKYFTGGSDGYPLSIKLPYIGWVHPDMLFPDLGWVPKLVKYLDDHPDVGKVSPIVRRFDEVPEDLRKEGGEPFKAWLAQQMREDTERPGNQCPWIMPLRALKAVEMGKDMWFDPGYKGVANYDDWDLNRRLIDAGFKVMITPETIVIHEGMGTRKTKTHEDNAPLERHNAQYYFDKFGDSRCPV